MRQSAKEQMLMNINHRLLQNSLEETLAMSATDTTFEVNSSGSAMSEQAKGIPRKPPR